MGDRWRPEGVRTERGSERVEAGADGGGRMRRILVELETRLVFQERVQGGGAKDYRTKRSFAEFHEACVLTCQKGIGATFPTFLPDKSAVIRSDKFHLCESPQS